MTIFPVFVDARPAYLSGDAAPASLLRLPLGSATLFQRLQAFVSDFAGGEPLIWTGADHSCSGNGRATLHCGELDDIATATRIEDLLERCEPSDWLLLMEASRFPAVELPLDELARATHDPRRVAHVVCADSENEAVQECVTLNADGSVQRIWRSYTGVTSFSAPAVVCTMISGAALRTGVTAPFVALSDLYRALAANHVPSQDLFLDGSAFDLTNEEDLLALNEHEILKNGRAQTPGREGASTSPLQRGRGCDVHASARMRGPVVLQDDVTIEAEATVVGPATIGAGARIGRGALVAQCLLAPGSDVPERFTVRNRVVVGCAAEQAARAVDRETRPPVWNRVVCSAAERANDADEKNGQRPSRYAAVKCAADVCIAMIGLALLSPLLLIVAALIKLDSPGPVLYGDVREGRRGRRFRCWKFRTMSLGADAKQRALAGESHVDGPQFKIKKDPRITRIGRWLRSTNIDELPQIINVACAQMSLIGPRPSPFRENQICVPWRRARLSVRPGITGLWQICRHDRDIGDFHQWIHYDMLYVRHLSPLIDAKILLATLLTLGGRWSIGLSWFIHPRDRQERSLALVPSRVPALDLVPTEAVSA